LLCLVRKKDVVWHPCPVRRWFLANFCRALIFIFALMTLRAAGAAIPRGICTYLGPQAGIILVFAKFIYQNYLSRFDHFIFTGCPGWQRRSNDEARSQSSFPSHPNQLNTGYCFLSGKVDSSLTYSCLSGYERPRVFSTCSLKPCIGFSRLYTNGTQLTTSTTFSSFFPRGRRSPMSLPNSTTFSANLDSQRQQKRI
jgi:hypothetical protein